LYGVSGSFSGQALAAKDFRQQAGSCKTLFSNEQFGLTGIGITCAREKVWNDANRRQ
jgi:hypothetical protein